MQEILKRFEENPFSSIFMVFWISFSIVFLITTLKLLGIQDMIVNAGVANKEKVMSRVFPQLQIKNQNVYDKGGE